MDEEQEPKDGKTVDKPDPKVRLSGESPYRGPGDGADVKLRAMAPADALDLEEAEAIASASDAVDSTDHAKRAK